MISGAREREREQKSNSLCCNGGTNTTTFPPRTNARERKSLTFFSGQKVATFFLSVFRAGVEHRGLLWHCWTFSFSRMEPNFWKFSSSSVALLVPLSWDNVFLPVFDSLPQGEFLAGISNALIGSHNESVSLVHFGLKGAIFHPLLTPAK